MITYVTYRRAKFERLLAADTAISTAIGGGWSVSEKRPVRGGGLVVLFRFDQDWDEGAQEAPTRPELPTFAEGRTDSPSAIKFGRSFLDRLRNTLLHNGGRAGRTVTR